LSLFSLNTDRFSKFFCCYIQQKIRNKTVITESVMPNGCHVKYSSEIALTKSTAAADQVCTH